MLCRQLIQWYIMTSSATDAETRRYFEEYRYFGLDPDQVAFFQQVRIRKCLCIGLGEG